MANPVTDLLEHLNHEVSKLSTTGLDNLTEVLDAAEIELTHSLANWTALGKGAEKFTPQLYRNALVQIRGVLSHIRGPLAEDMASVMRHGGVLAASLATKHLITEVTAWSSHFEGSVRPVAIEAASILAEGKGLVFKRFSNSAKRYAGQVGEDIRKQLAIGVVRGESIDQLTLRLGKLGGPSGHVYTHGAPGEANAKAEFISGGLFRRYRHYAERLAVTETVNAYNSFAMEGMRELEEEDPGYFKRWDAAVDKRTCPLCGSYDDLVVKLDGKFPNNLEHPPAHPRCRCAVVVWRKEWNESNHKDDLIKETVKGKEPAGVASIPHRMDLPKAKEPNLEMSERKQISLASKQFAKFDLEERQALSKYGAGGFRDINAALRSHNKTEDIEAMDRAFAREEVKLEKKTRLYRGIGGTKHSVPSEILNAKPGEQFSELGYSSTSIRTRGPEWRNAKVRMLIDAPRGTPGVSISKDLSPTRFNEREILLNRNMRFKVIQRTEDKGVVTLHVAVVSPERIKKRKVESKKTKA